MKRGRAVLRAALLLALVAIPAHAAKRTDDLLAREWPYAPYARLTDLGSGVAVVFGPDLSVPGNCDFYRALGFACFDDADWSRVLDGIRDYNVQYPDRWIRTVILETHGTNGNGLKLQRSYNPGAERSYISVGALQQRLEPEGVQYVIISACNSGRLLRQSIYRNLDPAPFEKLFLPATCGIIGARSDFSPRRSRVTIITPASSHIEMTVIGSVKELAPGTRRRVALGELASIAFPKFGIDPRICALVGMAAMFAGASRALLASVVFAFETTLQPLGLLPLLGGCTAGYLVSALLMRNTIMTEKLARRGVRVPAEYAADYLDQIQVADACSEEVVYLRADQTLDEVRHWVAEKKSQTSHQGFPVLDLDGNLIGVVTRRDFINGGKQGTTTVAELITRPPAVVFLDNSLREAADHMVREDIGRLPVVSREDPRKVVGIVTRSDLLRAHEKRLAESEG